MAFVDVVDDAELEVVGDVVVEDGSGGVGVVGRLRVQITHVCSIHFDSRVLQPYP